MASIEEQFRAFAAKNKKASGSAAGIGVGSSIEQQLVEYAKRNKRHLDSAMSAGYDRFDDTILDSVRDSFKSKWGDQWYYSMDDPDDFQRSRSGRMPKYLERYYDLDDPFQKYLYDNELPYESLFAKMYHAAQQDTAAQLAEKGADYSAWAGDVDSLLSSAYDDYTARAKSYQDPAALSSYNDDTGARIDQLMEAALEAQKYYTDNQKTYDYFYGVGAAEKMLDSIAGGISGLESTRDSLTQEHDYWNQFGGEDAYNQYQQQLAAEAATEAENERLRGVDLKALALEIAQAEGDYTFGDKLAASKVGKWALGAKSPYADAAGLYESAKAEKDTLAAMQRDYSAAQALQSKDRYAAIPEQPDFQKYAALGAAMDAGELTRGVVFGKNTGTDGILNKAKYARENADSLTAQAANSQGSGEAFRLSKLASMTDDEFAIYNYLLAKEGSEQADAYLDYMEETLNQRIGTERGKHIALNTPGFLEPFVFTGVNVAGGIENWRQGIKQDLTKDVVPTSAAQYANQELGKRRSTALGRVSQDLFTNIGNMVPSMLFSSMLGGANLPSSVVKGVGAAMLGAGATGNAYNEARKEGYGDREARNFSLLTGASEAGLSYLLGGISKVGGKLTGNIGQAAVRKINSALLRVAVKMGVNMAGEFTEEYLQEVLTPVFRNITLDENNEFKPFTEEALYSGMLGALSAGLLEGGSTVASEVNVKNIGDAVVGADMQSVLIENALSLDQKTDAYKLASQIQNGKINANASNIGELARLYEQAGGDLDALMTAASASEEAQIWNDGQGDDTAADMLGTNETSSETVATGRQRAALSDGAVPQQEAQAATHTPDTESTASQAVATASKATVGTEQTPALVSGFKIATAQDPVVQLSDGSTAKLSEVSFDSVEDSALYRTAAEQSMSTTGTNAFINDYDGRAPVARYAKAFKLVYDAAVSGLSYEQATSAISSQQFLSSEARQDAFAAGNVVRKEKAWVPGVNRAYKAKRLDKATRDQLRVLDAIGKKYGQKFVVEDTLEHTGEDGRVYSDNANAYYDRKDGSIHIGLDADKGAYMFFAVHEMTHMLEHENPDAYAMLRDFVLEKLASSTFYKGLTIQGNTLEERIGFVTKLYESRGVSLDREGAIGEIVADALPVILTDKATVQELVQLDRTLAERIRDFFEKFFKELQDILASLAYDIRNNDAVSSGKAEFAALSADMDAVRQISDMFKAALESKAKIEDIGKQDVLRLSAKARASAVSDDGVADQLRKNVDLIAALPITVKIERRSRAGLSEAEQKRIAKAELSKYGRQIDKEGFGFVELGENEIDKSFAYINGDAEYSALFAVPLVIKRGIVLPEGHQNHKGRGFPTVTIAAHVQVGDESGYMAVVVKMMGKNRYKLTRIISQDLKAMRFDKENAESTTGGGSNADKKPSPINSASKNSISGETEKSNTENAQKQEFSDGGRDLSVKTDASDQLSLEKDIELAEARDTVEKLTRENKRLSDMVDTLKAQFQITKGYQLNEKAAGKLASKMLRDAQSSYDRTALVSDLRGLFEYISQQDGFDGDTVMPMAVKIAMRVLDKSSQLDTSAYDDSADMRAYLLKQPIGLSEKQKQEAAYRFGSYESFRRRLFSRWNVSSKASTTLDQIWDELVERWPQHFEANTSEGDMVMAVYNALDYAYTKNTINPYGTLYDMGFAANELALQMFDAYFSIPDVQTFADKQAAKLRNAKSKFREMLTDMRATEKARYDAKLREIRKDELKKRQEIASKYKTANAEEKKRLHERYVKTANERLLKQRAAFHEWKVEDKAKRAEREKRNEYMKRIEKRAHGLSTWLLHPTEAKHVPEALRKPVSDFLETLDFSSGNKKDGTPKQDTVRAEKWRERLLILRNFMEKVESASVAGDADIYMNVGSEYIQMLDEYIQATEAIVTVRNLQTDQLRGLDYLLGILDKAVREVNTILVDGKRKQIAEYGDSVISDAESRGLKSASKAEQYIVTRNLKPVYFFEKLGGPMAELFDGIRDGQKVYAQNADNAHDFYVKTYKEYHAEDWLNDKKANVLNYKTKRGTDIELTRNQALSLYATAKREATNTDTNAKHLSIGGFVYWEDIKLKVGKKTFTIKDAVPKPLTAADVERICGWLTDEQKAFADKIVEYMSTELAALGNETSLKLYGFKKFVERYYFPYKVSSDFLRTEPGKNQDDQRLKHGGFTKSTVKGANNTIVLQDFTEVFGNHVNDMLMYNAMSIPQENMLRVFNYRTRPTEDVSSKSVKAALQTAYGEAAKQYIDTFLSDLNGGLVADPRERFASKWVSRFKKGAVLASLSVAIQQPASIVRAAAFIDPKYFITKPQKGAYEEAMKYSGTAIIKEVGGFDTGTGRGAAAWITTVAPEEIKTKVKSFLSKDSAYRDSVLGWLPQALDRATWAYIWCAVKNEVAETTRFAPGSEELLQATGKRFDEIIEYTQVYDSVISRSDIMRSKGSLNAIATSFMAEATVSFNMLYAAVDRARDKNYKGTITPGRTVAAAIGSIVLASLLKAVINAMRDDDKDQSYAEKYLEAIVGNLIGEPIKKIPVIGKYLYVSGELSPLGLIPYVRDVLGIAQGYDVERADMSLFSDLAGALDNMDSEKMSAYKKWSGLAGAIAACFGLPVKNVMRDIEAIISTTINAFQGLAGGQDVKDNDLWFAIQRGIGADSKLEDAYNSLYRDIARGNTDRAARLKDGLVRGKLGFKAKTYEEIDIGVATALRAADARIGEAATSRQTGEMTNYHRIVAELKSEGFKQDVVIRAINAEINARKKATKGEEGFDPGLDEDETMNLYEYDDLYSAVDNYDAEYAAEILKEMHDDGKEDKTIKAAITKHFKGEYIACYQADNTEEMRRMKDFLVANFGYKPETIDKWLED